jgi:pSer/pThr/pTyr-binding forkhead associated (FHA) protein
MMDPRLNSIHLETPRRQDFRRAREVLLDSRGFQTLQVELGDDDSDSSPSNTLIQKSVLSHPSKRLQFWLADDQYVYPLKVGLNTVGRSADNDVVVLDCFISRRHCAILVHVQNGCELHDTASKNGTFLNEDKLAHPTPLKPGDVIRICDRRFVFVTKDIKPNDAPDVTVAP